MSPTAKTAMIGVAKRAAGIFFLAAVLASAGWLAFERWVATTELPPLANGHSVTVLDRDGALLRAYTVDGGRWRLPVSPDDVDPAYVAALIAYEDKRFYRHRGVDPWALGRAFRQALVNGRIVSGGSTLTMQVARLLENSGTGRWGPKLRQIRMALALERRFSKQRILQLYLERAPYGGNLEGVRAATLSYFGKEPGRLTAAQRALLVALPQAPESRRPDRHPQAALAARNRVLSRLVAAGALLADEAEGALSEPIPTRRIAFPAMAPHLADRRVAADPARPVHRLTLRRALQVSLERLARVHVANKAPGLSAAILVMDHRSGEILASVGSAGFLDRERQGFNDMTRAIRSPGSTLKPLIYGLAFDAGLAHPETLIDDRPTGFGSYAPRNFDKQYYGTVSVRQALQYSLNIPAVKLLEAVGPARLISRMQRAGVTARLPGDAPPGLPIALGGVGLSLEDLVTLYGAIARGGRPVMAKYSVQDGAGSRTNPLMSPEAAWQVADILTGVAGPDLAPRGGIAYKTGTSYGYRDAWAIGFDGAHVIGVWIGRPDGASVPGILGAKTAAPLLFEAFAHIGGSSIPLAPPPPHTLMVSNAELPQPLRRFQGAHDRLIGARNAPQITYPPDGAQVDLGAMRGEDMPLVVKIRNGNPPFTLIANGTPFVIRSREREAALVPDGPGFIEISVVDAAGKSGRIRIEIR